MRKERKGYGVPGRIAGGDIEKGEYVLFFDDVVSSGQSKIEGVKHLEQLGANIDTVLVVVDREQGGRENIKRQGYQFHALATISELVNNLLKNQKISEREAKIITDYIKNPHKL